MKIDLDQIRDLLAIVSQTDVTELTIESGDQKITVRKANPLHAHAYTPEKAATVATTQTLASSPAPTSQEATVDTPKKETSSQAQALTEEKSNYNGLVPISSPMVGTFYRSPSINAPPFVEVGDAISVGQTVCIIEAMKLMNDLPAEVSGKIVKICVENGTTVEYGQLLFMVDPNG